MSTTRIYNFVDKSGWGPGEWQDEPDKIQWTDEATGLPCLAVRNAHLGHWCGYVGVAQGHPDFGTDYRRLRRFLIAHGSVNFTRRCSGGAEESGVCHVPEPGQPDHVWWIGFDCGHAWDISPGMESKFLMPAVCATGHVYRTLAYVQKQCTSLAEQIAARAPVRGATA